MTKTPLPASVPLPPAAPSLAAAARRLRHDLTGPLNACLGFALLLTEGKGGELPPLAAELLEDIVSGLREMQQLIDTELAPLARSEEL